MATPEKPRSWYRLIHWQILIALLLGVGVGALCYENGYRFTDPETHTVFWYPGELFLRLLKMIVLPLVAASIIVGVSSLNRERLGRIGLKTLGYYFGTTALAVCLGMVVVNVIRPGDGAGLDAAAPPSIEPMPIDDMLIETVPENIFSALVNNNVLSVIFFCIIFGLALAHLGPAGDPVRKVFVSLNEAILKVTMWIMALAPIGVFGLIAHTVVTTGYSAFSSVAMYMVTVVTGLSIHGIIFLPLLLFWFGRRRPSAYARAMSPALLTAFSTSSSSATLPVTIQSAIERGKVPRGVAEFVLPLGATVNMDGTALYEAVAVMFIAQAYGVDMSLGTQVVVAITATLAAIGAAGVPSAGTVTMILVLEAVGLDTRGVGLIIAVDRILDMCRTSVNVWGDAIGAAIIGHKEGDAVGDEVIPAGSG